jgi:hypothetical protein
MEDNLFHQLIATLFQARTYAHVQHIKIKPKGVLYGRHAALGEFYEGIEGLTDRFAEVYLGHGKEFRGIGSSITVPDKEPVEYVTSLEATLQTIIPNIHREDLKNIAAEMIELCNHILYKL